MESPNPREDVIGLEGPDYVALVIEWNDEDSATTLTTRDITLEIASEIALEDAVEPERPASRARTIAAVLGALSALVLAAWGFRRLRAA
jgi:hypothetical protein